MFHSLANITINVCLLFHCLCHTGTSLLLLLLLLFLSTYTHGMTVQLTACSYNMRGFNSTKIKYINDLLKMSTLVFLQELWLNDHQISELSNNFPGYNIHGVSAIDCSVLFKGQPKGGIAVIYPDSLGDKISFIQTNSNRLFSISLNLDQFLVYFFCVYMRWDCNEVNNLNEYESILNEISAVSITNNVEHLCLLGDMNTDFSRTQSWHTQALNRFIDHEDLYITLNHDVANVSYSYSNNYSQTFSILDHILLSKSLSNYIASYNSLCDDLENQSDHAPVVLSLNIYVELQMNAPVKHIPRKKWNTASHDQIDAYKSLLDDKLSAIDISNDCLNYENLLCTND